MSLYSWLRGLRRSGSIRSVPRRRCPRLRLVRLEDKTVPASFTAYTAQDLITDIVAANGSDGPDTITLSPRSKFTLTAVNNTTHGPTGLPVIAAGEDLTLNCNFDVIERNTAKNSGTPDFRLFDVAAGATLTIRNATLQGGVGIGNGVSPYDGAVSSGGAIFNQGVVVLSGVTVQNNTARGEMSPPNLAFGYATSAVGGGIYSSGSLTLTGCTVQNNLAAGIACCTEGGGIYATGSLTADGSLIQKNTALAPSGGDGAPMICTDLCVGPPFGTPGGTGGDAFGGGLYFAGGVATITNCTFAANTAQAGDGGDGYVEGSPGGNGGNASGGGLFLASGSVTLHGVTITANQAIGGTGGHGTHWYADGIAGQGIAGGVYVDPAAWLGMDASTFSGMKRNRASTSDDDIHGPYSLIP